MDVRLSRRDLLRNAKGLALATPLLSVAACEDGGDLGRSLTFSGPTMGTSYSVSLAGLPPGHERRDLAAGIAGILGDVDARMSNWRADSEVSRFNRAPVGAWTAISPDTRTVVEAAVKVGRLTDSAFDPTIGPLVDLWGFGPAPSDGVPAARRIAALREWVGLRHLRLQQAGNAVAKAEPELEINLSGIAKGFAVDRLAAYLEAADCRSYLVEVGGELRAKGHSPRGRPWRIGVEKPDARHKAVHRTVSLEQGAIATSGNYRNFFQAEGTLFSHIIDPRSGAPVEHGLASVTVIAPTTMEADALSTALMVLGPEAGAELAERLGLAALFVVKDGRHLDDIVLPAFERYGVA